MSLDDWRRRLDEIDEMLAGHIALRIDTVAHIAKAKRDEMAQKEKEARKNLGALSILRPLREKELLAALFQNWQGKGGLYLAYQIWRLLMGSSYKAQGMEKICGLLHADEEKDSDLTTLMRAFVGSHFGEGFTFIPKGSLVGQADVGLHLMRKNLENFWWSALWLDTQRWWICGAFPQVRLTRDAAYDRQKWHWWSDEERPPYLLVAPYGTKQWADEVCDMDVCIFGARSCHGDSAFLVEQIDTLDLWGAGEETIEGIRWKHRLYGIKKTHLTATTPSSLAQEMQAKFGKDGEIEWRLLGGYVEPLEIQAQTFFDGA